MPVCHEDLSVPVAMGRRRVSLGCAAGAAAPAGPPWPGLHSPALRAPWAGGAPVLRCQRCVAVTLSAMHGKKK